MDYILEGIRQGFNLLFPPKKEIVEIVFLSLIVSGSATLIAGLIAIPSAVFLALKEFRYKRLLIGLINTWLALPAVVIGLLVYIFLSRRGPLGFWGFLFTPYAMVIAQAFLAAPIVTALTLSALKNIAKDTKDIAYSLGANRWQMVLTIIREGKFAFLTAIITGFSRVIGETGMTLMVGGNIKGATRVLTTAIALETMKGNFEIGIALGVVLLVVALVINLLLQLVQGGGRS
ncbi:MAG TPA: ABC transporter permease [Elusimicrobia bacterium]|jgi:tungstate transport system permease protein|nr:ABC transporter permease [Elusimicrobiota bacterium]